MKNEISALIKKAEAILLTKDLSYSTHKGVIAGFSEHFIKNGTFDKKFGRELNKVYELRVNGDYEAQDKISKQQAETYLNLAKEFLQAAKKYLEKFK